MDFSILHLSLVGDSGLGWAWTWDFDSGLSILGKLYVWI